jgi:hypothetical protein
VGGLAKSLLLPPSPIQNRERGGIERRPAWREGVLAVPPMAAAGKRLKMERRPRGIDSRAHLVLGWSEEAAPREGGGSAAVLRGGGAVELGGRGEGHCGGVRRAGTAGLHL